MYASWKPDLSQILAWKTAIESLGEDNALSLQGPHPSPPQPPLPYREERTGAGQGGVLG